MNIKEVHFADAVFTAVNAIGFPDKRGEIPLEWRNKGRTGLPIVVNIDLINDNRTPSESSACIYASIRKETSYDVPDAAEPEHSLEVGPWYFENPSKEITMEDFADGVELLTTTYYRIEVDYIVAIAEALSKVEHFPGIYARFDVEREDRLDSRVSFLHYDGDYACVVGRNF